jgi:tRNA-dihydrouridine synthase 1
MLPSSQLKTQVLSLPKAQKPLISSENNENDRCLSPQGGNENRPDIRYTVAPMVGASELPFRLLCRQYGATLAYTPMIEANRFVKDQEYRNSWFLQTTNIHNASLKSNLKADRPLVAHFAANTPEDFAAAASLAAPYCDAVDLNLGCPQRTAYLGHFGSYLLGSNDRSLVCTMVSKAVESSPNLYICVKIRLLDSTEETIELIQQLRDAGASWVAVHARHRATWDRKGPGARDGPALLDQILLLRQRLPDVTIISNGNVINFSDCINNLGVTKANGIMSAEGILDNPALFLPRFEIDGINEVPNLIARHGGMIDTNATHNLTCKSVKKRKRLERKLNEIMEIEKVKKRKGLESLSDEERKKLMRKSKYDTKLQKMLQKDEPKEGFWNQETITYEDLKKRASEKINLAQDYLSLVERYPTSLRTVVFHIRRMLREDLVKYQLLDDCLGAKSFDDVQRIIQQVKGYQENPSTFQYDSDKAAREKEALARKKHEEGKRKRFEERMMRKAKREGKDDLGYYLKIGAVLPTMERIAELKTLPPQEQLDEWKKHHSQHCLDFHMGHCQRDRACAFLHMDIRTNTFVESEEVAG